MTAVPTLTAPSTPIDSCTRTGMKVRVLMVPPCRGGATSETFGTVVPLTSPRPMALPAARRSSWTRARRSSSPSRSATVSYPVRPRLEAATTTTGIPLSTQVTGIPPNSFLTFPVGSTPGPAPAPAPVPVSAPGPNSRITGAAVPGTPSMAVSPA
jgi:hypothetical protein